MFHTQYSDYNNPKDPYSKTQKVSEHRRLYLYSPWLIENILMDYTHRIRKLLLLTLSGGGDKIETHEFYQKVIRRKLLWWDGYRVKDRWEEDTTEFDRGLDSYLSGDQ